MKSALRMLSKIQGSSLSARETIDQEKQGSKTVLEVLKEKHPEAQQISEGVLIEAAKMPFHPIIFERIDGEAIRRAALHTEGTAGPSGIDAAGWRRMCTSFRKASSDLCNSMSSVAKRISSEYLDPSILSSYTACRLTALTKNPDVRPIGVAEVLRRIISKAVLSVIGQDIKEAAGSVQLCVGQVSGCEAGVHAMRRIFNDERTEAILLVDATNAFHSLNRKAALVNIHSLCPSLAIVATNTYRGDAALFIDGETVYSREGTTQGDPLAMSIYGIAILPLIQKLQGSYRQLWFADDASAGGKITPLKDWWTRMQSIGPSFGYHPNPSKTWLLTKEQHLETAKEVFEDCNIHITSTGQRHLGLALGSDSFLSDFVATKISTWVDELENLSEVAKTEPQAAYAALTHGLIAKWTYLMRTTPGISDHMAPLEEVLRHKFIPAITGRKTVTDEERQPLALPCRNGGLGIIDPTHQCSSRYDASVDVTAPLVELIMEETNADSIDVEIEQKKRKSRLKANQRKEVEERVKSLTLPETLGRAAKLVSDKGASNWLSAVPLERHGFVLHKGAFRDALYGWLPEKLPTRCECGSAFSINHALNCPNGAFPSL